jgi:hypothetical protein
MAECSSVAKNRRYLKKIKNHPVENVIFRSGKANATARVMGHLPKREAM